MKGKKKEKEEKSHQPIPITYDCGDFVIIDKRALGQVYYYTKVDSHSPAHNRRYIIRSGKVENVRIDLSNGEVKINNDEIYDTPEAATEAWEAKQTQRSRKAADDMLARYLEDPDKPTTPYK